MRRAGLLAAAVGCAAPQTPATTEWVDPMDPDEVYVYDPESMEDLDLGVGGGPGTEDFSEGVSSSVYEGDFVFTLLEDVGESTCAGTVSVEAHGHELEGEVRCRLEGAREGAGGGVGEEEGDADAEGGADTQRLPR